MHWAIYAFGNKTRGGIQAYIDTSNDTLCSHVFTYFLALAHFQLAFWRQAGIMEGHAELLKPGDLIAKVLSPQKKVG